MYQGEPGEEFGGRMTRMNGIDPSLRHRFAPDDDEVEARKLVGMFISQIKPQLQWMTPL